VTTALRGAAIAAPASLDHAGGLVLSEVISSEPDEPALTYCGRIARTVAAAHARFPLAAIGVEDFMKSFRAGRFQTTGLFKLARLNGAVAFACWDRTQAPVSSVMPNAVRSYFGVAQLTAPDVAEVLGPVAARKNEALKLAVLAYVKRALPSFETGTTRTGSVRATDFDRSDAALTALYALAKHVEDAVLRDEGVMAAACERWLVMRVAAGAHGGAASTTRRRRRQSPTDVTSGEADATARSKNGSGSAAFIADVSDGASIGVTRERLLQLHRAEMQRVRSGSGDRDDLGSADEVGGTVDDEAPARKRKSRSLSTDAATIPGPVAAALLEVQQALREEVRAELRRMWEVPRGPSD
jgi:hypothetical protein